jgi:aldehyde:ferredoxin oxidoreductase
MQPIVTIDLSTKSVGTYIIPQKWERDYLGGASLAARLLYDTLSPGLDSFSPSAPLLILNGPLTGTAGPAVGRFVVCGKSPATGLWAESNVGGFWGPELRTAGWDGVWITGKADKPVYIWIDDDRVEVRDAAHLWGRDTYDIQAVIKDETNQPGARVLGIGLAGEMSVMYASLLCDHGRSAGRTGLGAVMGSKNLKAIAVHGTHKIPVADNEAYKVLRSSANRTLKADTVSKVANELGTAGVADYADYLGAMPKKYYHAGTFAGVDKVSGSTMAETILTGVSACHACVIACGRVVSLEDGVKRKGPEYETIVGFGPNLLNDDLPAIVRLGELCDRYGMDTISTSNTIGLAFHLFEKGTIGEKDVGFPLRWGDVRAVERLVHMIAHREGIGSYLADGSRRFGRHFGAEDEAVQVNGLEVAYHDPRGVSGMALVYATSPRGACHNQSDYFFVDWGQADPSLGLDYFDRHAGAVKAANVARHQNWRTVNNALVLCVFANIPAESTVELVNAACGYTFDIESLLKCGERAWTLKRVINNRLGVTRANDRLPKALLEPLADGASAGFVIEFAEMLDAYYTARGWDPDSGYPTRDKLVSLGLEWAIADLYD